MSLGPNDNATLFLRGNSELSIRMASKLYYLLPRGQDSVKRMPKQVQESFVKLSKEEVGYLSTFYASVAVKNVADHWRGKSVSIVSPKSGRILRQREQKNEPPEEKPQKEAGVGFLSRFFDDIKKSKVSDFTYRQARIRDDSSYKPFWATKVSKEPALTEATIAAAAEDIPKRVSKDLENLKICSVELPGNDVPKTPIVKLDCTVEVSGDNALKLPVCYAGSKMKMPCGEPLYWCSSVHHNKAQGRIYRMAFWASAQGPVDSRNPRAKSSPLSTEASLHRRVHVIALSCAVYVQNYKTLSTERQLCTRSLHARSMTAGFSRTISLATSNEGCTCLFTQKWQKLLLN
ncbi:hypothetical protein EVAR_12163_1 [Eumeta japonica]|uniref:Uncharacterized protein n=1 Tax=Eumeta variegata TaxID=151549 RepID=A0A4C1UH02_EUMVA|nr:hypothetical protein EVAR_12163_1 [Eumeta japonica]